MLPAEVPLATILTMVEVDPRRPGVRRPDQVRRPGLRRGQAEALAAEKGWVFKPDGDNWRRVVPSPRPRRIFEIRPIRWLLEQGVVVICAGGGGIPTMSCPAARAATGRRRGGHRQGPRQRAAGPRGRRRPVRDGDRRRRVYIGLGDARAAAAGPGDAERAAAAAASRPARWARRSRPPSSSWRRPAGAPRSARSTRSSRSSTAAPAPRSSPTRDRPNRPRAKERTMATFGVHSEVGKLRKVMVHRPGAQPAAADPRQPRRPAVRRRAVGRARPVRARPVRGADARARRRGLLLQDLLGRGARGQRRGPAAADRAGRVGVHRRRSSLVDEVRAVLAATDARRARHAPHRRPDGRRSRASTWQRPKRRRSSAAALDDASMFVLPPLPNTLFTRDSSCWIYGGVSINPMFWPARRLEAYNVAAIYRYHPMFAERRLRVLVPAAGRRRPLQRPRLRPVLARGRRRAADRQRHRADRDERALPGPDDRADRRGRCSPRAPPSASSPR